jgi:hypothetical protein
MIDPQAFGETREQVRQLRQEVQELRAELREFRDLLSQARGGWRVGAFALSAAGVLGGIMTWAYKVLTGGTP